MNENLMNDEMPLISHVQQQYERKIFDLKQLIEISKGLNSSLEYNILIDSILLTCMGQMQLLKAGIFLLKGLDDHSFILHRNYKGYELDHHMEYIIQPRSRVVKILEEEVRCYTNDEIKELLSPDDPDYQTLQEIHPCLIVPLKGKGKLNGIIVLGERINDLPFSEYEKEYLLNIASLAGIAIQNAYLYELATTDMMTKLKIHHFFQTALIEERERAAIHHLPLSLIMVDIDHFKKFNDAYGHQCGDLVLKNVAKILKERCRQIDIAARYGGEELAIILPNTDLDAALIAAERIRHDIENAIVEKDGKTLSITVSLGVAQYDQEIDKSNHDFIERADKALYLAKKEGRNKVAYLS